MSTSFIINFPYSVPSEQLKSWQYGEPLGLAEGRHQAGYMVSAPQARPHREKQIFKPLPLANQIRQRVAAWREAGYPGITGVTIAGELESDDANKIAVWMLDTDCDDRIPYPNQVFFPMADSNDGWTKLAKNLRIEIDGDMIKAYGRTQSLPFELGKNSRIVAKVVDDRESESFKVSEAKENE